MTEAPQLSLGQWLRVTLIAGLFGTAGEMLNAVILRFLRGVFAAQRREASDWATITLPMAVGAWAILYGLVPRPPVAF